MNNALIGTSKINLEKSLNSILIQQVVKSLMIVIKTHDVYNFKTKTVVPNLHLAKTAHAQT